MYINLESDYAVRILLYLIKESKVVEATKIAESTGVTIKFTHKIMRKLSNKKIVKSQKGARGGYIIIKPADEITLLDIIELMEGEYTFSRCLAEESKNEKWCNREGCKAQTIYKEITKGVRDRLNSVRLIELL